MMTKSSIVYKDTFMMVKEFLSATPVNFDTAFRYLMSCELVNELVQYSRTRLIITGSSSCGETRGPAGHLALQERSQEIMSPSGTKTTENKCSTSGSKTENPFKKPSSGGNKGREIGMNAMEDMPCVFTKGDGPNGRRIDGILYRYGKGADVRIMCVCHGDFLSPAEFVKHAGGGDVDHPLRHIVINPSSTAL